MKLYYYLLNLENFYGVFECILIMFEISYIDLNTFMALYFFVLKLSQSSESLSDLEKNKFNFGNIEKI